MSNRPDLDQQIHLLIRNLVEMQPGDAGAHPALDWALEQIATGEAQTLVTTTLRHLSPSVANLPPLLRWPSAIS